MLSLLLARGHAAEPLESGGSVARARTDHTLWCYSEWELNFINIDGAIWYIWRTLETRCHSALGTSAPCATSGSGWARAPAGHSAAPRSEGSTWGPRFYFWTGGTARQRSGWECRTKELSENFSTRCLFSSNINERFAGMYRVFFLHNISCKLSLAMFSCFAIPTQCWLGPDLNATIHLDVQ